MEWRATENYFVDPRNFTADGLIRRDSSCLFPAALAIALARSMHLVSKSQREPGRRRAPSRVEQELAQFTEGG
jgi:hypothetical protein